MNQDSVLRQQLVNLLTVEQAHMSFEAAVQNFPMEHINTRPPKLDYTFWHLVEHLRICQWDILDYIRNPQYQSMSFPKDYWPDRSAKTDAAGWQDTVTRFLADRQALVDLVQNPDTDLYSPIPHGYDGHNILREILIVADHNTYHIGELGILRQMMALWS
ncbi:MAG: DinB family protein [Anaerolineae bacterium]|nr:DinB family protein [Anaerolineae bacterium]